jgi:hypothetical protein
VIALPNESAGPETLEVPRSRLLGYGIADFVLDRWLTLYYGVEPSALSMIPFAAGSTDFYRALCRTLWNWLAEINGHCFGQREVLSFFLPRRLPLKFSLFLLGHPEIRLRSQSFFQTGLAISRRRRPFWPSLLLGLSDRNLVVISDQYDGYPSIGGLEATSFSLSAVKHIAWTDRSLLRDARIAIDVEHHGRSLQLSWPACPQLRSAALRWIERINSGLAKARQPASSDVAAGPQTAPTNHFWYRTPLLDGQTGKSSQGATCRGEYRIAYEILLIPALLTLGFLLVARFIYPTPGDFEPPANTPPQTTNFSRAFWIYLAAAALVAAGFADFSLVAFHFKKTAAVPNVWIPVFYSVAMAVSGLGSLVFGRLFDRRGIRVLMPLTLIAAISAPLLFLGHFAGALIGAALWGLGMGVHESIIPAAVATMVPATRRPTAYGLFTGVYGVSWFLGSVLIGFLYEASPRLVVLFSVLTQIAAIPVLRRVRTLLDSDQVAAKAETC